MAFPFAGATFLSRLSPHRILFALITAILLCVTLHARAVEPKPQPDTFGPYRYFILDTINFVNEEGAKQDMLKRFSAANKPPT
ncbi:hypothetical protein, partial [Massilia scottii]|uniref:hypothetical protein n=1 Tax=Massilia scottii TaxID=3057166 RepID=UPI002796979D